MAAKHVGMKADAFQWVTTDFSQRDNVIVRGDVDGATYFHDSAVSLFQRIKPSDLSVLSFASAGLDVYGNAVLASTKLIAAKPQVVAGFVRATNRAVLETFADPAAAMEYVKKREPMVESPVEIERWKITAGYIAGADTRADGIGDVRTALVEKQIAEVAEAFGLKSPPTVEALYDRRFLPPKAERMVKA